MKYEDFEKMDAIDSHNYLYELYNSDPERFKEECEELINTRISSYPEEKQTKLSQFQFTLQRETVGIKNNIERMNRIGAKMFESFYELNDCLEPFRSKNENKE